MSRTCLKWTTMLVSLAALLVFAAPAAMAADRGPIEICGDGIDNDEDGTVDEAACQINATGSPVSGNGIVPETWGDNPKCADMGYSYGFKIGNCPSGTYTLTDADGELSGGAPNDPSSWVTIECYNGTEARLVDWSSNLAMDAAFIKGGSTGGNLYVYEPESTGPDTGLGVPDANNAISHIEFCYDYELDVSKTAAGTYTERYDWTIDKESDGTYSKFIGDPATTHDYSVAVDQTVSIQNIAVAGSITIANNTSFDAVIESVLDVLNDGTAASVDCGVAFPYTLGAGADPLTCVYTALPSGLTADLNTATVTTSGIVGGAVATAPVSYAATVDGFTSVNIVDDNGESWTATGDATFPYSRDFLCSSDPASYSDGFYSYQHVNTATITETGASDTATVTVNCYAPEVSKTASGSYDESHTWEITKTVDPESQSGFAGDVLPWTWTVEVSETPTESNYAVSGSINVSNPAGSPGSMTVSLSDQLSDGTIAVVDCGGGATSVVVAPGVTESCQYSASPDDASATGNTASALFNGITFAAAADVSFVANVTAGTATVTDDEIGLSESLTAGEGSWTFTGSDSHTCSSNPGDYGAEGSYSATIDNTAVVTDSEGASDNDDASTTYQCYAPSVTKTATPSWEKHYDWDITKNVDNTEFSGFAGDEWSFSYDIDVELVSTDELNFAASGVISVTNPHPSKQLIVGLSDSVDTFNGVIESDADCGFAGGTLTVPAASTATCGYTVDMGDDLDGQQSTTYTNTATATTSGGASFSGSADFSFGQVEPALAEGSEPAEVTAKDDDATPGDPGDDHQAGPFSDSTSDAITYVQSDLCPTEITEYTNGVYTLTLTNTAILVDTDESDSETVTVNCYAPIVEKTAEASYDERHTWDIDKSVNPTSGSGFVGDSMSWTWTVTLNESSVDENFSVTGSISVSNPADAPASINVSLADQLNDGTIADVDCGGGATDLVVAPGTTQSCSYTASPPDASATLNTATATFNSLDFAATGPVQFTKNVIDGTADVDDEREPDFPITVNAGEGPWTWTETENGLCSTDLSRYEGGGSYSFTEDNTATVTGSEGQTDSASASATFACYAPSVRKTAAGEYTERHEWEVEKTVSPVSQAGFAGDDFTFDWTVTVTESIFDEEFGVTGVITVDNPNPDAELTVALSDVLNDDSDTAGVIDDSSCSYLAGNLTVAAGGSETCTYSATPPDSSATFNTVTISLNGVDISASDPIEWSTDIIRGTATLTDDQEPLNEHLEGSGPTYSFTYPDSYTCEDAASTLYVDGSYNTSENNTAIVSSEGEVQDEATATADFTCRIPAMAKVIKTTSEGPEDIGAFPFEFGLFAPGADTSDLGNATETGQLYGAGTVNFSTELEEEGSWTVVEFLPEGWITEGDLSCSFDVAYPAAAAQVFTCEYDNVEMSRVDLLKLTNGIVDPDDVWNFVLYEGPDGFDGTVVASDSTPAPDTAGVLKFGETNLDPGAFYTLCELEVPAGWSSYWQIDTDGDGIGDAGVTPYNPNADDDPPEDLGNRCVDIGPGTGIALVPGETLHVVVDNQMPGGAPRTPGYWKNWNRCTGGGQQYTADTNGGWEEGYWLLEDVLDPSIGGGIVWDDIVNDDLLFSIGDCETAVLILDKRDLRGKKQASDPLHNLATHLLAAQLNFGAGACTTQDVLDAALAAETLLDDYDFDGYSSMGKKDPRAQEANALATYLDEYNNGLYCGDGVE